MRNTYRPQLDPTPVPQSLSDPAESYITCSPGQWDPLLKAAYDTGWTLIEMEGEIGKEKPVRAWKKDPLKAAKLN